MRLDLWVKVRVGGVETDKRCRGSGKGARGEVELG